MTATVQENPLLRDTRKHIYNSDRRDHQRGKHCCRAVRRCVITWRHKSTEVRLDSYAPAESSGVFCFLFLFFSLRAKAEMTSSAEVMELSPPETVYAQIDSRHCLITTVEMDDGIANATEMFASR